MFSSRWRPDDLVRLSLHQHDTWRTRKHPPCETCNQWWQFSNRLIRLFFSPGFVVSSSLERVSRSHRLLDGGCTFDSNFFEALMEAGGLVLMSPEHRDWPGLGDWSWKSLRKGFKEWTLGDSQDKRPERNRPAGHHGDGVHKQGGQETKWDLKMGRHVALLAYGFPF